MFHITVLVSYMQNNLTYICRPYIERYKPCKSAAEVSEMQETILREIEETYQQSRRETSMSTYGRSHCPHLTRISIDATDDLLVANPNHQNFDVESESESESRSSSEAGQPPPSGSEASGDEG